MPLRSRTLAKQYVIGIPVDSEISLSFRLFIQCRALCLRTTTGARTESGIGVPILDISNLISSSVGQCWRKRPSSSAHRWSPACLICFRKMVTAFNERQRSCPSLNLLLSTYKSKWETEGSCRKSPMKMMLTFLNLPSRFFILLSWELSLCIILQSIMETSSIIKYRLHLQLALFVCDTLTIVLWSPVGCFHRYTNCTV